MATKIRPADRTRGSGWRTATLTLAALLLRSSHLAAQPAAAAEQLFQPTGEYLLQIDKQAVPDAKVYVSPKGDAYLIVSSRLAGGPVLIDVPGHRVSTVVTALLPRADGSLAVAGGATLTPQGSYAIEGESPTFTVAGAHARLVAGPPLLGEQTADALLRHDPGYGRRAAAYQPDAAALARLAAVPAGVRLRVYFGSWCPICAQAVPRLIKVIATLKQPHLAVEYYGLPQDRDADPEPARMNLHGLPTAIVYGQGNKELGRITDDQWRRPEVALRTILGL
jgi:thiol-disulfide isomerase/thioredoxin